MLDNSFFFCYNKGTIGGRNEVDVDAYYSAYMLNWQAYGDAGEEEIY